MKQSNITVFLFILLLLAQGCRQKEIVFGYREIDGQLSAATSERNLPQMKILIARGADINKTCCGRVPTLHAAAYNGDNEIIKFLLAQGAKVDIGGKFRETALMIAAQKGNLETVKILVANGANVNAYDTMEFATPLKLAKQNRHQEIVNYLIAQGAKETIWWHRFIKI